MERKITALAVILVALAGGASGWGRETHRIICEEAVYGVWGPEAVERCLSYNQTLQRSLCGRLLKSTDVSVYDRCILETDDGVFLHPAVIPYELFNDSEDYDYSDCPAAGTPNEKLMCGDPWEKPAADNAEEWFTRSINADGLCDRIACFCIASNYYADSKFKLNRVRNLKMCYGSVEDDIDSIVRSNDSWKIEEYCSFEGWVQYAGRSVRKRHSQVFTFSSGDLKSIVQELTGRALYIKTVPYVRDMAPETKAATTTQAPEKAGEGVATTVPLNETQVMYDTLMEEVNGILEDSLDMLQSLGGGGHDAQPRGRGNIFINAFIVLLAVAGLGIGAFVFLKTEAKRREKPEAKAREKQENNRPTESPR